MSNEWTLPWAQALRREIEEADYEKEIYLLSAPRQGNTITRYILEHLTGYKSYGYIGSGGTGGIDSRGRVAQNIKSSDKSGIIWKRHQYDHLGRFETEKQSPDSCLITIVRNPLDWKMRVGNSPNWNKNYGAIIEGTLSGEFGRSKFVFYEEMVSDPSRYTKGLADFIDSPPERLEAFLENIGTHMNGKKAPEQKTPNQLEPNLSKFSEEERIQRWNDLMSKFSEPVQEFFNRNYPNGQWPRKE